MKKNMMRRNLRQSIVKSLGRYIAIMAIIALGASIFVGLLMTKSDMVATGQRYTDEQNMFDLRLVNSYGWSMDQVDVIRNMEGVVDAEGVFYTDIIAQWGRNAKDKVYRFYNIPDHINRLVLLGGRMPESPDECLADGYHASDSILGSKVTISPENEESTLETALYETYTVVGYVSTPLYMDMNRGTTSVGGGNIDNYFFVPMEGFDADYYTEIHVTMPGQWEIYSSEYNDAMEALAEELEPQLEPLAWERLSSVKEQAEEDWADGYAEYQDGVRKYHEEKEDAEAEIRKAYRDLTDGEQEMADSRQKLIDGEKEIEEGRREILEGRQQISDSRSALASGRTAAYAQMAQANMELIENYKTVTGNLVQVKAGLAQLSTGMTELEGGIAQLESGLSQIDSGISMMDMMIRLMDSSITATQNAIAMAENSLIPNEFYLSQLRERLEELQASRAEYAAQRQELQSQRDQYGAQLQELYDLLSQMKSQKTELENNKTILEQAVASIDAGFLELRAAQTAAENQFTAAEAQLNAAEAQLNTGEKVLDQSEKEIRQGWTELEEGEQELAEGWEEYYNGVQEMRQELKNAREELLDGRLQLEDARDTIDEMTDIQIFVLDRNSNVGYVSLDSSSDIVQGVSRVFPAFFLLVAALVCITTMTRMVEDERTQIGTLKALGYSNAAIMGKYMGYAGSGALLGCGLGVLAGSVVFPMILWEAYKIMLFIRDRIVLTFNWQLCAAVVGAYTVVILMVTWYCCRKALKEVPAELIRPKAPEAGKQLIFEKWKIWNRVSFLNKVMIRNIFRYKQRLAMMLIGIGGCTALLLTGFGLRDSIVNIVDFQFEEITLYDMEVYFDGGLTSYQKEAFRSGAEKCSSDLTFFHQSSAELEFDHQTREVYLISGEEDIRRFIDFHDGDGAVPIPGENEVVMSVGIAEILGIGMGDTVTIRDPDMRELTLTVSGIYFNHVNNNCFILPETFEAQWGELPEYQMAYVKVKPGYNVHSAAADLTGLENVMNVSVSEDLADMVGNMMAALDLVVVTIVFCAALLAAIVLYNLTNINITERIREIATIKVLGFRAGETAAYVFKENLTLSAVGTIFGLGLGKLLLDFVISQVKIESVWFDTRILLPSFLWSMVLTMLTACIVDFIFYFRLEKINMAEALKSVE